MYRSSALRSTLNTNVITGLGMCKTLNTNIITGTYMGVVTRTRTVKYYQGGNGQKDPGLLECKSKQKKSFEKKTLNQRVVFSFITN